MNARLLIGASLVAAVSAAGQAPSAAKSAAPAVKTATKNYTPPKTPWGDPDLQGQWPATANIPMQRPANMGTRAVLTDEEVGQRLKQRQQQDEGDAEEAITSKDT